jgi:Na+/H+ antiporter NhaD/arsenite permease-like protein
MLYLFNIIRFFVSGVFKNDESIIYFISMIILTRKRDKRTIILLIIQCNSERY